MLIPINFLLSFACLLLLVQKRQAGAFFRLLLLVFLLHTVVAGLGALPQFNQLRIIQPLTAVALPLFCYLALCQATGQRLHLALSVLALLLMAGSSLWLPQAIDGLMAVIWMSSAAAMLITLRQGRDTFCQLPLESSGLSVNGWRLLAVLLIAVALIDISVAGLLEYRAGSGVQLLTACGNLLVCLLVALTLLLTPATASTAVKSRKVKEGDAAVLERIDELMRSGIHRETGLNLEQLARKSGIPSRQVSAAINALHRQSVSQYVNSWRIAEACEHLCRSQSTIIEIMENVGFQTKSNFNREFLRITGKTPSQWRKESGEQSRIS